jgi:hypothetical protein
MSGIARAPKSQRLAAKTAQSLDVGSLDEPEIYANRLLGIKINTTDKITMRNKDGKIQKDVQSLADAVIQQR